MFLQTALRPEALPLIQTGSPFQETTCQVWGPGVEGLLPVLAGALSAEWLPLMVGELGQEGEVALVAARAERPCMQTGRGAYALAGEMAGGVEAGKCVRRTWL